MKAKDIVKGMLEDYYGEGSTEELEDNDLNVRIYKAGIKEVVEWVKGKDIFYWSHHLAEWEKKLKEWEIDDNRQKDNSK